MKYSKLIKLNDSLSEIIHSNFELLTVFQRFGIKLGFGDKNISEICEFYNINHNFFIEIINIFHDKEYFPDKKLQSFSIKLIVDFLKNSHVFYNDEKIPFIESLIDELYWNTDDHDRNLSILKKFFYEYKTEVKAHTLHEEETVYPYAVYIEENCKYKDKLDDCYKKMKVYSITDYAKDHDDIEEKLTDLKNIIIKYLPPPQNQKTAIKILFQLFLLEKDLNNHARIEEKILVPKIMEMEMFLKSKIKL
ncbi:MAG: hemerythrin domain-containing protein [Bacteroidales bacterium]|nr:hemerythrin domain-containing protein [Bacteroidales bacterium]MBN2755974.1 hemerythrin domain-containing protein [Bacteroidales bacterium]